MARFSERSRLLLTGCDPRIQRVLQEAIQIVDFKVLEGHRSIARQQELYAQGRSAPGPKVTNVDGVRVKGKHNDYPARAVDIAPYNAAYQGGVDWDDREAFVYLAGIVRGIAFARGVPLRWGGDWDSDSDLRDHNVPMDLPHFELTD